jgi:hypothetical protein
MRAPFPREVAMSDKHPPKQRRAESLPTDTIEIVDTDGETRRLSGEAILVACAGAYAGHKPLRLGTAGPASLLSGKPGYLLRVEDVELALTEQEILHLLLHALPPAHYFTLRESFGSFAPIADAYYDPQTGAAIQPMVRVSSAP